MFQWSWTGKVDKIKRKTGPFLHKLALGVCACVCVRVRVCVCVCEWIDLLSPSLFHTAALIAPLLSSTGEVYCT